MREPEVLPKGGDGASSVWWGSDEPAGRRPPRGPSREPRGRPLIAALLSCLLPGAGQLYLGERRRGAVMLVITVLFLVLRPGTGLDDELRERIRAAVRTELSPRHVPDRIEAIAEVPRTLSGKKLEVPVKRVLSGVPLEKAVSEGALANPDAIHQVVALARE